MDRAEAVFETFIAQWKSGGNAELNFFCERGQLRVTLCADVGPWRAPSGESGNGGSPKQSPSRVRRRERRATERERSAAEVFAAEKAATEVAAAEKAAAEVAKAAAEVASTSSCGKEQPNAKTCWNCDQEMTFDHQCDVSPVPAEIRQSPSTPCSSGRQPLKGVRPEPSPPMILKKPVRMLDGSPVLPSRPK